MKRRAFLSALLALPVAPLAIKGLAEETPAPPPETDFPEGYRTFAGNSVTLTEAALPAHTHTHYVWARYDQVQRRIIYRRGAEMFANVQVL